MSLSNWAESLDDGEIIPIARLCIHHRSDEFDSGVQEFDQALDEYQKRSEAGYRDVVFVALDPLGSIVGYLAIKEIILETLTRRRRYLYLPHVAVTVELRGSEVFPRLVHKAYRIHDLLQAEIAEDGGEPYYGAIVNSHGVPRIEDLLQRHGFRRMLRRPHLWWVRDVHSPLE